MQSVRTVWLRGQHVQEAVPEIQHMQKAMTKMNIQLANVLSDISGVSGQAIIGAILMASETLTSAGQPGGSGAEPGGELTRRRVV
jgi:hypothetical protein